MVDFNDPRTGLSGTYALYKRHGGKLKNIKKAVDEQHGYQLNKTVAKPNFFPILGKGVGSWQIDLLEINPPYNGINKILCCVNVNNRYAYCYAIKNKTAGEVGTYIQSFFNDAKKDGRLVKYVQSDQGPEFMNKNVQDIFKEYKVEHDTVAVADHAGQGIVERFNQTLRRLIELYTSSNNNNNWVNVLPDLVYNYNHRYHSSLKDTPANTDETYAALQKYGKYLLAKRDFNKIKVGDKVRVLNNKNVFDKGRMTWSNKVYVVDEKTNTLIQLNNGLYYTHYQLQKVNGNTTADDYVKEKERARKEVRITRRLAKEGIEGNFEFEYPKDLIGTKVRGIPQKEKVPQNGIVISYHAPYYKVAWDDGNVLWDEITKKQVEMYHQKYLSYVEKK